MAALLQKCHKLRLFVKLTLLSLLHLSPLYLLAAVFCF